MDKEKIKNYIPILEELLFDLKSEVSIDEINLIRNEELTEFTQLKKLLNLPNWPEAVNPALIGDLESKSDQEDRATAISTWLLSDIDSSTKFLDFGTGSGLLPKHAFDEGVELSIGYDIVEDWNKFIEPFDNQGKFFLTTDWGFVESKGPYNKILMYDVIDRVDEPVEILSRIRNVLSIDGELVIRCHPWCGRHGGNLYRQINKAYVHLVFSDDELMKLGYEVEKLNKVIMPLSTYNDIFTSAGFEVIEYTPITEPVENYFSNLPLISSRIKRNWRNCNDAKLSSGTEMPIFQMSMQFIDYRLKNL